MKYLLLAIIILCSFSVKAQNYKDSTRFKDSSITVTTTQRGAIIIGTNIRLNALSWENRLLPSLVAPYVQNGQKLDSLSTITVPAWYITGMLELLNSSPNAAIQTDKDIILNNTTSIPGYTGLATQIVTIANGNTSQKKTAMYIRDLYLQRLADFQALHDEYFNSTINWAKH